MYRLGSDLKSFTNEASKLQNLQNNLYGLPPTYQKLVAEITLLRLFYLLEQAFELITCKVVCRASYLDGSKPLLLIACSNIGNARIQMRTYNRPKGRDLRWTTVTDIEENAKYVLSIHDNLLQKFRSHKGFIDEVRGVRNHIAHNSSRSRTAYKTVVSNYYGAALNNITPGALLLSSRFSPCLINQYLSKSRILIKELVKG
jgi:hypothetical protein